MQILFQKGCFYPRCLPSPVECTATRSAPPPEIYQWSHLTGDVTCGFNCNAVQQQEIYSDPRGSGRVKNVSVMVEDHHSRGRHWSIQLKWGSVWKHVLGKKKGTLTWIRTPPPPTSYLSVPSPRSRKCVAWHNFWSLTPACGEGEGRRCWLDVSFALGHKLLCEQTVSDFSRARDAFERLPKICPPAPGHAGIHWRCRLFKPAQKRESVIFILFCTKELKVRLWKCKSVARSMHPKLFYSAATQRFFALSFLCSVTWKWLQLLPTERWLSIVVLSVWDLSSLSLGVMKQCGRWWRGYLATLTA